MDLGVSHGDDNFILYTQVSPVESLKSQEDAKMSKKMILMWTKFAHQGMFFSLIQITTQFTICFVTLKFIRHNS